MYSATDTARMATAVQRVAAQRSALHTRGMVLGYNVVAGVSTEIRHSLTAGTTPVAIPYSSYNVYRIDQPHSSAETFDTEAEVDEHLARIAALPRYRLELEGNSSVRTEKNGEATVVIDTRTRRSFTVPTDDLEASQQLFIHAADAPTIGGWTLD